jgi:hypothetical protein
MDPPKGAKHKEQVSHHQHPPFFLVQNKGILSANNMFGDEKGLISNSFHKTLLSAVEEWRKRAGQDGHGKVSMSRPE